jgi:hypothetical protein
LNVDPADPAHRYAFGIWARGFGHPARHTPWIEFESTFDAHARRVERTGRGRLRARQSNRLHGEKQNFPRKPARPGPLAFKLRTPESSGQAGDRTAACAQAPDS